jgi:hypothetical protein
MDLLRLAKLCQASLDPIDFAFELFEHQIKVEVLPAIDGYHQPLPVSFQFFQCLGVAELNIGIDNVLDGFGHQACAFSSAMIRWEGLTDMIYTRTCWTG